MTEEEIIDRVTNVLTPPFKVGDAVTPRWETKDFKKAVITKIEMGWVFIFDQDTRHAGATSMDRLKHYVDS